MLDIVGILLINVIITVKHATELSKITRHIFLENISSFFANNAKREFFNSIVNRF